MNNTNATDDTEMTNGRALVILFEVRAKLGRNYKRAIRMAWMNGDYEAEGLGDYASRLQRIRNAFGPTWLVNAKLQGRAS